jgi:cation:H+ antiporter
VFGYILGLAASLVALTLGGDQLVIGVARLAGTLRVRPTVVGAVVGGLGGSLPALMVSGVASFRHSPEIAVGNLVGSIIANISLALAIAALVAPVRVDSRTVRREAPISVASVLLFAALLSGGLSAAKGLVLVGALAVALSALLVNAQMGTNQDELAVEVRRFFDPSAAPRAAREIVRPVFGLLLMVLGAEVLVRSASGLAVRLGMAQEFIGLTVVAVGTSAPLIVIAIQAARRGNHDLVVGTVLGSNLFIALGGGAILAFTRGGPALAVDIAPLWLMAGSAVAAWAFIARGSLLNRSEAAILLLAYGATLLLAPR